MTEGRMTGTSPAVTTAPLNAVRTIPGVSGRMSTAGPAVIGRMPSPAESEPIPKTPWGFVAGLASNLASGVVDTVKGLGQLFLVAPAHDLIQLGAGAVPGVQGIEKEPSALASVARTALPGAWFPGPDLGGKWGSIASDYAHRYGSPSKFGKALYEDPLSFIMDALVVADGIGAVAKAGRVGVLNKLPTLVSDTAAGKILGPALRPAESPIGAVLPDITGEWAGLARYGETPYASFSRAAGKYEGIGLSKNMLIRGAQRAIYKGLSYSPEQAIAAIPEASAQGGRIAEVVSDVERFNNRLSKTLASAESAGVDTLWSQPMRIFKKGPGRLISSHENSKILSALRIRLQDGYQGAIDDLLPDIPDKGYDYNLGEARAVDAEDVFRYDQALDVPKKLDDAGNEVVDLPNTDPYPIIFQDALPISGEEAQKLGSELPPLNPRTAAQVNDILPLGEGSGIRAFESPYAPAGRQSFQAVVDDLDMAEQTGAKVLKQTGHGNDIRAFESVSDPQHGWEGIDMYGRNADGELMHVSVGTKEMFKAQEAAVPAMKHLEATVNEVRDILYTGGRIENPVEAANMADRVRLLQIEAKAVREYLKHELFYDSRASHWEGKIDELTGKPYGYNPELKQAMRTRPWRGKHVLNQWVREEASAHSAAIKAGRIPADTPFLPYTKMMERKFTLPRMERLMKVLADWKPKLEAITDRPSLPGILADSSKYLDVVKFLDKQGVPEDVIRNIMSISASKSGLKKIPSATALIEKAYKELYDYTIREGGAGGIFEFAPWDWRVMQDELVYAGKPVPSYLPWLPEKKASGHLIRTGSEIEAKSRPLFEKDWNEVLAQKGKLPTDMPEAMVRASRVVVTHDEMAKYFQHMDDEFGRPATRAEATLLEEFGDSRFEGEVFYDPNAALSLIDTRGQMLSKTLLNIPETGDVVKATTAAAESLIDEIFKKGLNNLDQGSVRSIPKHVADMMQREMRTQLGGEAVKLFWETPLKVWKASVLSLSPRWVINNIFGNLIFTGIENPSALRRVFNQADGRTKRLAKALLGEDQWGQDVITATESGFWHEMLDERGRLEWSAAVTPGTKTATAKNIAMGGGIEPGGSIARNIARPAVDLAEEPAWAATLAKMNAPSRSLQVWSRGIRKWNSHVEAAWRRGILIDELSRTRLNGFGHYFDSSMKSIVDGAERGFSPAEYRIALDRVDRVLGNFTRYSPIEQNVIRKYFMPFYGFYRHMTNVLLRLPLEHPLKASLFRQVEAMDQIMYSGVPGYLQGDSPLHLGEVFGHDTWLRLKNMNPLSQVTEQMGGLVGLLSPQLKLLIERSLGINTFTGETYDPEDVGQGENIVQTNNGEFWEIIRDEQGNVMDVQRTGRPLPSMLQHIGSQFGILSMLPSFSLYPKSIERNIASWAGLSTTQPKGGTEAALQYDAEMKAEAMARAIGSSAGFGSFASFGSFGSF